MPLLLDNVGKGVRVIVAVRLGDGVVVTVAV
jgi:hypothetical protein